MDTLSMMIEKNNLNEKITEQISQLESKLKQLRHDQRACRREHTYQLLERDINILRGKLTACIWFLDQI